MSRLNEEIVKEYFESLGFMVSRPCKYTAGPRARKAEEEIDMIVHNPLAGEQRLPDHLVWETSDLAGIARAVVGVRVWHSDRFYASIIEQGHESLQFAQEPSARAAARMLGAPTVAKILCLADLPASSDLRSRATEMLKQNGVDGVLLFSTILQRLIATVDRHSNYDKSDVLQMIRILKSYNLIKDKQLDLFDRGRRGSGRRKHPSNRPVTSTQ